MDDVAVQDVAGYIVVLRDSEVRVENDGDANEGGMVLKEPRYQNRIGSYRKRTWVMVK